MLLSTSFLSKSKEFTDKYEELFILEGTIYQKGIFNPIKAEVSFSTLDKQGFFASGHKVHFKGERESIDKVSIDEKIQEIRKKGIKIVLQFLNIYQSEKINFIFQSSKLELKSMFIERLKDLFVMLQ